MTKETLWPEILKELQKEISEAFFKAFFAKTKLVNLEGPILEISCASEQAKAQIEKRYYAVIKSLADNLTQKNTVLKFVADETKIKAKEAPLLEEIAKAQKQTPTLNSNLSPRYTFDTFVIGPNNRLAVAVARAITENPGTVYNPFFMYSGVGLGKTHLMQAIGNEIKKKNAAARVVYLTGESFTNEMIEAIQSSKKQYNAVTKFREKYRTVDALLIDDVQFIAGRESTQEEFFHTFNALYLNRKQIIMTSDRPPKDIAKLEERLSSRFLSGMTADIQAPDLDMRVAILRQKRDALNLPLTNEVVDFIAERVISNVRELEGALLQVAARGQTQGTVLTIDEAARTLGEAALEAKKNYSSNDVMKAVATYYSLKLTDLRGPRRLKEIVWPRQIAMFLVRGLCGLPVVTVGELFGGRDHSTVIHSTDKIELALKTNSKLNQDVVNIKATLV